MMTSLSGLRVLLTGGSGTIGKSVAQRLVQAGAAVVLAARNETKLRQACESIQKQECVSASSCIDYTVCDITDEASVVSMFEQQPFINILINNAGINPQGSVTELSLEDFQKALQVNVTGPILCSREAMKRMQSSNNTTGGGGRGGRIINIGSLSAVSPRPNGCAYTTSKFALLGLTQSLALDGRPHGIAVGIIHPGNVESKLLSEEVIRERRAGEGFLQADQIADCVLTMASLPPSANVLEMTVLPTKQPFVGRG